jgi:signal transduction histidine kinase
VVSRRTDTPLSRMAALAGRHPALRDVIPVVVIVVIGVGTPFHGHGAPAFTVAMALPLLWRRRAPVAVFGALAAVAFAQWCLGVLAFGDAALLVALYTVASTQPARTTLVAAAVLEAGIVLAAVTWEPDDGGAVRAIVTLTALASAAGVLGINHRNRRALLASLEERAARLERERDQQGRLSAAAERSRIAREMHDIVAHNLSVMIALADGASYAVRDAPDRAEQAMQTASRTGRQALTEMRRLLGVLREEAGPQGLAPQPGLGEIDELVAQVRAAGVEVWLDVQGRAPETLPPGLQLAAYRIVQEALTNMLKHAGPTAHAAVALRHGPDALELEIADTGVGGEGEAPAMEGGGLRGMRERAAVYDGDVTAGPAPGGAGWRVAARLPLPQPAPAEARA